MAEWSIFDSAIKEHGPKDIPGFSTHLRRTLPQFLATARRWTVCTRARVDEYMIPLLARIGQSDTCRTAQSIWNAGKRKRTSWICAKCTDTQTLGRYRGYGDDSAVKWTDLGSAGAVEDSRHRGQAVHQQGRAPPNRLHSLRAPGDSETPETTSDIADELAQHDILRDQSDSKMVSAHFVPQMQTMEDVWEQLETDVDNEPLSSAVGSTEKASSTTLRHDPDDSPENQKLLEVDYRTELSGALLRGEPDLMIRCLLAADQANDLAFVRGIPATTFSEILRLLESSHFISDVLHAHRELSSTVVRQFGIAPAAQIAFDAVETMRVIVGIRRSSGVKLSLSDYMLLLKSARNLGKGQMAYSMFNALLGDGLQPTTACYNLYMASIIWNGVHQAVGRHSVRVIPFNMLSRRGKNWKPQFKHYRVGRGGVREATMKIFNDMLANDVVANEESFRLILLAAAREGGIEIVQSILRKVWHVDVDGIMEGKDESSMLPRQLPEHSILRPGKELLFAVAHAFGINNNIPAALRVVDFLARHYEMTISDEVWTELFEWTFVLSVTRTGSHRRNGNDTGQLPEASLTSLWDTMTGAPYFVKPSLGMYNHLIKNLFYQRSLGQMMEKMEEARKLCVKDLYSAIASRRLLKKAVKRHEAGDPQPLEHLRNDWEYRDLIRRRNRFWLGRWLRLLLGTLSLSHTRDAVHTLPSLLWNWRELAPSTVQYDAPTGRVELEIRTMEYERETRRVREVLTQRNQALLASSAKLLGNTWIRGGTPERKSNISRDYEALTKPQNLAKSTASKQSQPGLE